MTNLSITIRRIAPGEPDRPGDEWLWYVVPRPEHALGGLRPMSLDALWSEVLAQLDGARGAMDPPFTVTIQVVE